MKKIINKPDSFVDEFLEGILRAHDKSIEALDGDNRVIVNKNKKNNKVGIVTAGGSGHLPLFLGYVGDGMIDGCAVGNVFASPSSTKMFNMIKACDFGKGVLCLYGNYNGDKLNFEMASGMAEMEDISVKQITAKDDVASSSFVNREKRRGVAGLIYAYKIAGAASNRGYSLDDVCNIIEKALENIKTMGVALTPCIVPEVGYPTFKIEDDEMEIGMGIHGEVGIETTKILSARELTILMFNKINEELALKENDNISVMINGLGATPLEEQYIVFNELSKILEDKKVKVVSPHIGEFATSMEMAGLSITIFKLNAELEELLLDDVTTPFYTNFNRK